MLLKQDSSEAESTVNGRIEFIGNEMYVLVLRPFWERPRLMMRNSDRQEQSIKELEAKMDKVKGDIIQVQSSAQNAAASKQAAIKV